MPVAVKPLPVKTQDGSGHVAGYIVGRIFRKKLKLENCLEEGHAPGQPRASNKARAAPTGKETAEKYTRGKYAHLVQH
jgi:hypothetical protein